MPRPEYEVARQLAVWVSDIRSATGANEFFTLVAAATLVATGDEYAKMSNLFFPYAVDAGDGNPIHAAARKALVFIKNSTLSGDGKGANPLHALIYAMFYYADTDNARYLQNAFPELYEDHYKRYKRGWNGWLLPEEQEQAKEWQWEQKHGKH